ncbi:hypothetical protein [Iningainema tapete]|uniref:Uncharacterized protein n=1 Tax=Iningainema tapete BLCC-T55 TaxID=2748662 RepID=A0A8J6XTD4_9CYAN|nr:hypothetical protein [Iningainema tapete]MBD2773473.1 hypothetical protein [Iningainema tapete BLCC-T55]
MLEKLMQAAIITFLLHLLAGISPHTTIDTAAPAAQPSTAIARAIFDYLQ